MRYLSVCSGIEAASVAWMPLGWEAAALSEIAPFPRAVLAHRFPDVPLHGDFKTIRGSECGAIDVLVGGTPCQSFSVAGSRGGMADHRGNLALEFCRLAGRVHPRWIIWENVPGVLSSNGGRDFGSLVGALAELGYGWAYRILDAQHFGVPQRRRRVFLVGCLGDYRRAAAVLLERHCLQGHSPPRTKTRQQGEVARCLTAGTGTRLDGETETLIFQHQASATRNFSLSQTTAPTKVSAICFSAKDSGQDAGSVSPTLRAGGHTGSHANAGVMPAIAYGSMVRRLTPLECERLQGFPDNWTRVPWRGKPADLCPDGPRYKVIGNSMAVPVVRWIGRRIEQVERCCID